MKRKYLIIAAVFALAGCGGNGSSNPPVATCGLPGGITQVALVYPGSGATGVTNNPGQIITASNNAGFPQNQNWGVQIVTHGGNPANSGLLGAPSVRRSVRRFRVQTRPRHSLTRSIRAVVLHPVHCSREAFRTTCMRMTPHRIALPRSLSELLRRNSAKRVNCREGVATLRGRRRRADM